jgi:hypothetical protein
MLKRLIVIVFLFFAPMQVEAANYTDVYYSPTEPGWGVFLVQSEADQFLAFFIYDQNGNPVWYTAQLKEDANGNYSGTLYALTGTYFALPWQGYNIMPAGTASFEPTDTYHATLRYTVTGKPMVVKPVQRQNLTDYQLAGNYSGSMSGTISGCASPSDNDPQFRGRYGLVVTQAGGAASTLTFTFVDTGHAGLVCTIAGPLTLLGRLYQLANGTMSCSASGVSEPSFPVTINSYHPTGQGIEGRLSGMSSDGCTLSLRFAAVLNN